MLTVTDKEKTRYCYDLCILTITLTEHYMAGIRSIEFMFDTFYTNAAIAAAPVHLGKLPHKIKFEATRNVHLPDAGKVFKSDWKHFVESLTAPNLQIKDLFSILKTEFYKSIVVTNFFKQEKRDYFLKFGKVVDNKRSSSFNELRHFYLNYLSKYGNANIIHTINKVKFLMDVSIQYEEPSAGDSQRPKMKKVLLSNFLPNALSYLYNILIVINRIKEFLNSLPSFHSDEEQQNLTKIDIIRNLKKYLNFLNCMTEKSDCFVKYSLDKNYLKKVYNQNFVNYCWEQYNAKNKAEFNNVKLLDSQNIEKAEIKNYVDLLLDNEKKETDQLSPKPHHTNGTNKADVPTEPDSSPEIPENSALSRNTNQRHQSPEENGLSESFDMMKQPFLFPSYEKFILSSRDNRICNTWYLHILLVSLRFSFAPLGKNRPHLAVVDQLVQNLVRLNNVAFKRLAVTPSDGKEASDALKNAGDESQRPTGSNILQFYDLIKKIQLPYSYSILMVIVNLELIVVSLIDCYRRILEEVNMEFHEDDAPADESLLETAVEEILNIGNLSDKQKKDTSRDEEAQRRDSGSGKGKGGTYAKPDDETNGYGNLAETLSSSKDAIVSGSDQKKSQAAPERPANESQPQSDQEGESKRSLANKAAADVKIDRIIQNLNSLTNFRTLIIEELSSKKVPIKNFLDQLVNILSNGDTKKKPSIHKFTRREEKIIKTLFCEKAELYFDIFNKIIYNMLVFTLPEEAENSADYKGSNVFNQRESGESAEEIKWTDNGVLKKVHLNDLRYKFIGIKLTHLIILIKHIKQQVEENPKVIEKKHDDDFGPLIDEITTTFHDLRRLLYR